MPAGFASPREASMIEEPLKRNTGLRPFEARHRTGAADAPSRPGPLVQDMEELRACVLKRLDAIEGLARDRAGTAAAEIARLEKSLKQRIDELEAERGRLRSGSDQEEMNWKQLVGELENDRRLLADAWERLEHERIEFMGVGPGHGAVQGPMPAHHRNRPLEIATRQASAASAAPAAARAVAAESGNPVAENILRQFQALSGDVRRATESRYSSR